MDEIQNAEEIRCAVRLHMLLPLRISGSQHRRTDFGWARITFAGNGEVASMFNK